jgi:hypothetical protein
LRLTQHPIDWVYSSNGSLCESVDATHSLLGNPLVFCVIECVAPAAARRSRPAADAPSCDDPCAQAWRVEPDIDAFNLGMLLPASTGAACASCS